MEYNFTNFLCLHACMIGYPDFVISKRSTMQAIFKLYIDYQNCKNTIKHVIEASNSNLKLYQIFKDLFF